MKRLEYLCLFFLCCLFLALPAKAEEAGQAQDITALCGFSLAKGNWEGLLDRDTETGVLGKEGLTLEITGKSRLCGIYLIWNGPPPAWTLTDRDTGWKISGGKDGFWHEYADIPEKLSLTLTWEGEGTLAELYLFGPGQTPTWVQKWNAPCEKADLLLLPTHADDEHLYFGGTMPYYAGQRQLQVQVVYLMKHVPERTHELLNGLWTVGITNYPVISEFIDKYSYSLNHAKTLYPEDKVLEYMVENIRRFRPEVIVGHDLEGEYGHGAHQLNAYVLSSQALTAAADPGQFPESAAQWGCWETKKCYLHLYPKNEIFINWADMPLSAFGGKSAYAMAEAGYWEHVSQRGFFTMTLNGKYGNGRFGLFFSTVGPDVIKNDCLENIPPSCLSDWTEPELPDTDSETQTQDSCFSETDKLPVSSDKVSNPEPRSPFLLPAAILVGAVAGTLGVFLLWRAGKK